MVTFCKTANNFCRDTCCKEDYIICPLKMSYSLKKTFCLLLIQHSILLSPILPKKNLFMHGIEYPLTKHKAIINLICLFLPHLHKRLCLSVSLSVGPSFGPSVRPWRFDAVDIT